MSSDAGHLFVQKERISQNGEVLDSAWPVLHNNIYVLRLRLVFTQSDRIICRVHSMHYVFLIPSAANCFMRHSCSYCPNTLCYVHYFLRIKRLKLGMFITFIFM